MTSPSANKNTQAQQKYINASVYIKTQPNKENLHIRIGTRETSTSPKH